MKHNKLKSCICPIVHYAAPVNPEWFSFQIVCLFQPSSCLMFISLCYSFIFLIWNRIITRYFFSLNFTFKYYCLNFIALYLLYAISDKICKILCNQFLWIAILLPLFFFLTNSALSIYSLLLKNMLYLRYKGYLNKARFRNNPIIQLYYNK